MKNPLTLFLLFSTIVSFAQSTEKSICGDTAKYRIKKQISAYPELEIKIKGEWKAFTLIDELPTRFECECAEMNLSDIDSKGLVIRLSNASYGSGGGLMYKEIQIWNLNNGERLFDEITSCAEENFGRGKDNPYYNIECRKVIEIQDNLLIVHEKLCDSETSAAEDLPDPTEGCPLTTLEPGVYRFENGALKKK